MSDDEDALIEISADEFAHKGGGIVKNAGVPSRDLIGRTLDNWNEHAAFFSSSNADH